MSRYIRNLGLLALVCLGGAAGCNDPEVVAKYEMHCLPCHSTGAAGAPRPGVHDDWKARRQKGMTAMIESVNRGMVGMPPKGTCKVCTNEDLKAITELMLQ